jgi:hypothetical protein
MLVRIQPVQLRCSLHTQGRGVREALGLLLFSGLHWGPQENRHNDGIPVAGEDPAHLTLSTDGRFDASLEPVLRIGWQQTLDSTESAHECELSGVSG